MRIAILAILLATGALAPSPTFARDDKPANTPPEVVNQLFACRAIADTAERVACYDGKVDALQAAMRDKQVVVTDAAKLRQARRGLFGLSAGDLVPGGGDAPLDQIEGAVATARINRDQQWQFTLDNGAVWQQISLGRLLFDPKHGSKVRIWKGALGIYFASIDGQRSIKVRRER